MQSRIEMICEDVNVLNSIAPEPKLTRTMIICEDVNRNDNNADNPGLLTQQDAPPDGTINVMNNQEQNSLFCAPASPERSPSVMEQKPNVWRQQLVQPQRGLGGGSRAEWDSSNRPVRLPRLVRRGVGGLKCGQTGGSTATNFSGRPKCLFKCAASKPKSSIYPDMPCLTCYEMRGYYGSGGGGQYFGGGGESEFDELLHLLNLVLSNEEKTGVEKVEENVAGEVMSAMMRSAPPPPRLLPAPECADAFTNRWFIAAPQRTNIESIQNYHQNQQSYHQLNAVSSATTSTNTLAYASSGNFFNSNCYNNSDCIDDRNCLENCSVFLENYHLNHSHLEQYQNHQQYFSSSSVNNNNTCINQNNHLTNNNNQNNNQYSPFNFSSSPQCLASTTTPSPSFSNPPLTNNNNNDNWKLWIDDLVCEVQSEVRAEKKLFCVDRRSSLTFSDISVNVGSSIQNNTSDDDDEKATRFESNSVVSPSLYSQSSSGCSSSSSIGCSPYSYIGSSSTQKQTISSNIETQSTKRAKKNSLQTLSREELAERKKQQNRVAAQRYRNRRTRTLESEKSEIEELEYCNAKMRKEQELLSKEIEKLRGQLLLN